MRDEHCHVFDPRTLDDFFWRRWRVPASVLRAIGYIRDAIDTSVAVAPAQVERALRATGILGGWADLLRTVYAPPITQVRAILQAWDAAGITGGCILVPAIGDARDLTARVVGAIQVLGAADRVRVYAPVGAQMAGVYGVKLYPSLEPDAAIQNALASGRPIVAHYGPGGVRAPGVTRAQARRRNGVQWLADALQDGWRGTVVLAHGAGHTAQDGPIDRLLRDTCPGVSDYPGADVRVDTAYVWPVRATALPPWWSGRVVVGSDYPLHLPQYAYADWARAARRVWG